MGQCPPSGAYFYEEVDHRSETALEFWDRDYLYVGFPPRLNVTVMDHEHDLNVTAGLDVEQVRAIHRVLGDWLLKNGTVA
jgi:hypothetical protein